MNNNANEMSLSDMILAAKGNNRTVEDFAKKIGVSRATVYNAISKKNKKPLSDRFIIDIYKNRCSDCEIELEQMRMANSGNISSRPSRAETIFRNIIIADFVTKGIKVLSVTPIGEATYIQSQFGSIFYDMVIDIDDKVPYKWYFEFLHSQLGPRRFMDYNVYRIFLNKALNNFETNDKVSFVFDDKDSFNGFVQMMKNDKIDSYISAIFVDLNRNTFNNEIIINKYLNNSK